MLPDMYSNIIYAYALYAFILLGGFLFGALITFLGIGAFAKILGLIVKWKYPLKYPMRRLKNENSEDEVKEIEGY